MGIPLAIEASRALGLDDYVILHKTPKIHLGETWAEPVYSITTDKPQRLRVDPARVGAVRGKRVAVVDDVISTGASLSSALRLVRRMEAEPVVIGTLMTDAVAAAPTLGRARRWCAPSGPCRCSTPTTRAGWSRTGADASRRDPFRRGGHRATEEAEVGEHDRERRPPLVLEAFSLRRPRART